MAMQPTNPSNSNPAAPCHHYGTTNGNQFLHLTPTETNSVHSRSPFPLGCHDRNINNGSMTSMSTPQVGTGLTSSQLFFSQTVTQVRKTTVYQSPFSFSNSLRLRTITDYTTIPNRLISPSEVMTSGHPTMAQFLTPASTRQPVLRRANLIGSSMASRLNSPTSFVDPRPSVTISFGNPHHQTLPHNMNPIDASRPSGSLLPRSQNQNSITPVSLEIQNFIAPNNNVQQFPYQANDQTLARNEINSVTRNFLERLGKPGKGKEKIEETNKKNKRARLFQSRDDANGNYEQDEGDCSSRKRAKAASSTHGNCTYGGLKFYMKRT